MTREEMVKRAYKPYMVILYRQRYFLEAKTIECLLVSIDFDNELVTLQPLESANYDILTSTFITSISNCSFPKMHRDHSKIQEQRKLD